MPQAENQISVLLIEKEFPLVQTIRRYLADASLGDSRLPGFTLLHTDQEATAVAYAQSQPIAILILSLPLTSSHLQEQLTTLTHAPILILADDPTAVTRPAQAILPKYSLQQHQFISTLYRLHEQKPAAPPPPTAPTSSYAIPPDMLIAHNPDGLLLLDSNGRVQFANEAAHQLLQTTHLVGNTLQLPPMHNGMAELTVNSSQRNSAVVELHINALPQTTPPLYIASLRDITEHKRVKRELSAKATELEIRNTALDEFGHTMAHQIQGLLSQMMGYASFIEMQYSHEMDADLNQAISRIVQSGHKMNNVISELLLLASMRTGNAQVTPLHMQRIVTEAIKRLRYQIRAAKAVIHQPAEWPIALGHGPWIEEAWLNYISNAIKYGGDPPTLQLGSDKLPNGQIRFWVQDNGVGISMVNQKQLFRAHTRFGPRKVRGEGLGLSIVHRIIARCNGEVGVESEEGKGSLFWFTLPEATEADLANL
jgi:signal transduction histidine kinase